MAMIQEGNEYVIRFTRNHIRGAAGELVREGDSFVWRDAKLTDEECDEVAEELAGIFDDEFMMNVREALG